MEFEFEYIADERKYTTSCPRCGPYRKKQGTKSLMVYNDKDAVRWECQNPGCDWNERQYTLRKDIEDGDDAKKQDNKIKYEVDSMDLLRDIKELPDTIDGDRVAYYRDVDGKALFGIKRTDRADGTKFFTPVVQTNGTLKYGKGAKYPQIKALFGAEDIKDKDLVVVVEGEKAALAGQELFSKAAVVTWRGGANNVSSGDWELLEGKDVFLWPDNDPEGFKAMEKVAESLKKARRIRVAATDHLAPKADIGDALSKEAVLIAFEKAKDITNTVTGRMSLTDLDVQDKKLNQKMATGWDVIDNEVLLPSVGLVIVEARDKQGKSQFAVNLSNNMLNAGKTVQYFSYELGASRIISRYARSVNPCLAIQEAYGSKEAQPYKDMYDKELIIYDQSKRYSVRNLLNMLDSDSNAGHFVVIDHCHIIPMKGADRHSMIKEFVDELANIAHSRGFLVLLLCQLTQNISNPMHDTPRYAQDIHYTADMVIRLWYKENHDPHPLYDATEGNYVVHINKNRDGAAGMRFGFNFDRGASLTPTGAVDREYKTTKNHSEDRKSDIKQLVELLQDKKGDF